LAFGLKLVHQRVDVFELSVAVWVVAASHGVFEVKAYYFSIALSLCCLDPEREPVFAMRSR